MPPISQGSALPSLPLDVLSHDLRQQAENAMTAKVAAGEPILQPHVDAFRQAMSGTIAKRRTEWQAEAAATGAKLTSLERALATDLSHKTRETLKKLRCGTAKAAGAVSLPDETALDQAHELSHIVTPQVVRQKLFVAWLAVMATALLDIGLMYDAQHRAYLDPLGNFTGNPLTLAAISCSSLAWFWIIGWAWQLNTQRGRAGAVALYLGLLALIYARIAAPFGNLFGAAWDQGNNVFQAEAASMPVLLSYLGILIVSVFYTVGGLLFLRAKTRLSDVYQMRDAMRECQRRIALHEDVETIRAKLNTLRNALDESSKPQAVMAMMKLAEECGMAAAHEAIQARKRNAEEVITDVMATRGEKGAAKSNIETLERLSTAAREQVNKLAVAGVLLMAGMAQPVLASITTSEIFQTAGTFLVMLDLSPSPGTNAAYIASIYPEIAEQLRSQPVGTLVRVHGFGNPILGDKVLFRARIQAIRTSDGDTRDNIERQLKGHLLNLSKQYAQNAHQRSEVLNAVADSAALVNPQAKRNTLIMITDGIENSDVCRVQARVVCKLPPPHFSFPRTAVSMYGVGDMLPGSDAQRTISEWKAHLKKAGAVAITVRRQ